MGRSEDTPAGRSKQIADPGGLQFAAIHWNNEDLEIIQVSVSGFPRHRGKDRPFIGCPGKIAHTAKSLLAIPGRRLHTSAAVNAGHGEERFAIAVFHVGDLLAAGRDPSGLDRTGGDNARIASESRNDHYRAIA